MGEKVAENEQRGGPPAHWREEMLADDEVSLFDLWGVLADRKWIVFGVFLAVTLLAGVYAVTRTPAYTVQMIIEIGEMPALDGGVQRIESPEAAAGRLNEVILPNVQASILGDGERLGAELEAEVISPEAGLLRVHAVINPADQERYFDALEAAAAELASEQSALLRRSEDSVSRQIEALRTAIETFDASLSEMEARRTQLRRILDGSVSDDGGGESWQLPLALQGTMGMLSSQDLLRERARLHRELNRLVAIEDAAERTQILRDPQLEDEPQGTGPTLILALGVVLGGMLGIFAAFFREFVARANEHRRGRAGATH